MAFKIIIASFFWFALLFHTREQLEKRLQHYGNGHWKPFPDQWVHLAIQHYTRLFDGTGLQWPYPRQEYCLILHLPIYGMQYQIHVDDFRWSQTCVYIGSQRGARLFYRELPPVAHEMR